MNPVIYIPQSKRLLEQLCEVLRYKHYSLKTEQAYCYWVRFFIRWHGRTDRKFNRMRPSMARVFGFETRRPRQTKAD